MTVTSNTLRGDYACNGATTVFTVPFQFFLTTEIKVIKTDTTVTPNVVTTLVNGTDYTVSGGSGATGSFTTVATYPTGIKLTVLPNLPFTQTTHYVPGDPFPAASHEAALDRLALQDQQMEEALNRAMTIPAQLTTVSNTLPVPVANAALVWDPTATFLTNGASAALAVASFNGRSGIVAPAANDYNFAQLSGSVAATQLPAFTGDVTTSAGSTVTTLAPTQPGAHTWSAVQTFSAGTVGLPSTTLGDSTTGFYRSALNQWAWGASGVNILTFSSSGLASTATLSGTTITASSQFTGPGTGLTGTASSLTSGSVIPGGTKPHFVGNGAITRFSYDGSSTVYRTDWQGTQQLYSTPRTNFMLYSDQFDNAAWVKIGMTVTAGAASGPSTLNADFIKEDTSNGSHGFYQAPTSVPDNSIVTGWIDLKAGAITAVQVVVYSKDNTAVSLILNLSTGAITSAGGTHYISSAAVALPNGYWRPSITFNSSSGARNPSIEVYAISGGLVSYVGDGASGFYACEAQMEVGAGGTSYIPTTTAAVTVTDYTVASNVLTTATAPLAGAVMEGVGAYDIGGNAATASTSNALQSATTTVNVSSATAPTAGQVLTATSGTAATWQTPAGGSAPAIERVENGIFYGGASPWNMSGTTLPAYDSANTHTTNSGACGIANSATNGLVTTSTGSISQVLRLAAPSGAVTLNFWTFQKVANAAAISSGYVKVYVLSPSGTETLAATITLTNSSSTTGAWTSRSATLTSTITTAGAWGLRLELQNVNDYTSGISGSNTAILDVDDISLVL